MAKAEYRSAIRSRKLINSALADLLQEKPLDKITVTDVVQRADINRGTFYAHYTDIPDVIDHLAEQSFHRIRDMLMEQPRPLSQVPDAFLELLKTILEEDLDFYRKVMASNASSLLLDRLCSILIDFLFQHEDAFSTSSHEEYVFSIYFCAGGLTSLYRNWFSGRLPYSLDMLTQEAAKMLHSFLRLE